jgi:hypothetical protein
MNPWQDERERAVADALDIEARELRAERDFDRAHAAAQARGDASLAMKTPEFDAWMAARRETDSAWGRWYQVMATRPGDE